MVSVSSEGRNLVRRPPPAHRALCALRCAVFVPRLQRRWIFRDTSAVSNAVLPLKKHQEKLHDLDTKSESDHDFELKKAHFPQLLKPLKCVGTRKDMRSSNTEADLSIEDVLPDIPSVPTAPVPGEEHAADNNPNRMHSSMDDDELLARLERSKVPRSTQDISRE